MDNNNLNNQPKKEEGGKKRNKFVAWWLGLHRAAQVGICAGAAVVLASAITLPIVLPKVLNNGGNTPTPEPTPSVTTFDLAEGQGFGGAEYGSSLTNLKKDVEYSFKLKTTENLDSLEYFVIIAEDEMIGKEIKTVKIEGPASVKSDLWKISSEDNYVRPTTDPGEEPTLSANNEVIFTITTANDVNNVKGCLKAGGK